MFSLNTKSGMLHNEDHGGGSNAESFDRADAADRSMHTAGKRMTFCKQCFPDNKNAADDTTTPEVTPTDTPPSAGGSPTENTTARGTMPPRVTDPTADGKA